MTDPDRCPDAPDGCHRPADFRIGPVAREDPSAAGESPRRARGTWIAVRCGLCGRTGRTFVPDPYTLWDDAPGVER